MTKRKNFYIVKRNRATEDLMTDPKAYTLLSLIASRARYNNDGPNPYGLKLGEALINNRACGLTMKEYRNAKERLRKGKQAVFRRATTGASRGTIARLLNSDVFDINADLEGQAEIEGEGQSSVTKGATNKKEEKERRKRKRNTKEKENPPTASRSPSQGELEAWQEKQIEKIMAEITEKDHAEIEEHCGAKAIGCCVMKNQEKPLCHTCNTGQRQYARNRVAWICMKCGKVSGWIHEDTHLCQVCYDNEAGW